MADKLAEEESKQIEVKTSPRKWLRASYKDYQRSKHILEMLEMYSSKQLEVK